MNTTQQPWEPYGKAKGWDKNHPVVPEPANLGFFLILATTLLVYLLRKKPTK